MGNKNMIHLQREHLLNLKLEGGDKKVIQKVQQAVDTGKYGHKEFKLTKKTYKPSEFLELWGNPPSIEDDCVQVYLYLGLNYIQKLQPNKEKKEYKYYWTNEDKQKTAKKLDTVEKAMCDIIFDKSY
jgi:hypothetical protein